MFGEYLRGLREARGYTLRDFAKKIGIVASYLSDIERDCRNSPGDDMLGQIEFVLGLDQNEKNKLRALALNDKCNLPPDIIQHIREHPEVFNIIRDYCSTVR